MATLNDRQLDVLRALALIRNNPGCNSKDLTDPTYFREEVRGYWAAPLDFGGTNGSHHSATATALAKMGLVERYKSGRVNFFASKSKGSCGYRISQAGIDYLAKLDSAP